MATKTDPAARRITFLLALICAAVLVSMNAEGAAAASVPEPDWPAQCPLKVGLFLDRSSSIASSFGTVQKASEDLVDALRGQHSQVMVVGFGTEAAVARPLTDVGTKAGRTAVKEAIADLSPFGGNSPQSGTNWESALTLARSSGVQVAVILTDGFPTVSGNPPQNSDQNDNGQPLKAATKAADNLKNAGTRIVPVGIGSLVSAGGAENLSAISGGTQGDDFFVTDVSQLRRELYQVASKSCGIPVAGLPQPEPPGFPLKEALIGAFAVLALLIGGALVVNRVRNGPVAPRDTSSSPPRGGRPTAPIRLSDVAPELATEGILGPADEPADDPPEQPAAPPARGRSMSLDFLTGSDGSSDSGNADNR